MAERIQIITDTPVFAEKSLNDYRKGQAGLQEADFPRKIVLSETGHSIQPEEEAQLIISALMEPILSLHGKGLISVAAIILFGSQVNKVFPLGDLDVLVVHDPKNRRMTDEEMEAEEDRLWDISETEQEFYGTVADTAESEFVNFEYLIVGDRCTTDHKVDCLLMERKQYNRHFRLSGAENQQLIAKTNNDLRNTDPAKAQKLPQNPTQNWLQNAITSGSILIWGENIPDQNGFPTVPHENPTWLISQEVE